jgi:hypothetical protein
MTPVGHPGHRSLGSQDTRATLTFRLRCRLRTPPAHFRSYFLKLPRSVHVPSSDLSPLIPASGRSIPRISASLAPSPHCIFGIVKPPHNNTYSSLYGYSNVLVLDARCSSPPPSTRRRVAALLLPLLLFFLDRFYRAAQRFVYIDHPLLHLWTLSGSFALYSPMVLLDWVALKKVHIACLSRNIARIRTTTIHPILRFASFSRRPLPHRIFTSMCASQSSHHHCALSSQGLSTASWVLICPDRLPLMFLYQSSLTHPHPRLLTLSIAQLDFYCARRVLIARPPPTIIHFLFPSSYSLAPSPPPARPPCSVFLVPFPLLRLPSRVR